MAPPPTAWPGLGCLSLRIVEIRRDGDHGLAHVSSLPIGPLSRTFLWSTLRIRYGNPQKRSSLGAYGITRLILQALSKLCMCKMVPFSTWLTLPKLENYGDRCSSFYCPVLRVFKSQDPKP